MSAAGVALVAAIAFWALHVRCSRGSASATVLATTCIVALAAFSVVTGLSIGPFVLPIVILLAASAVTTPPPGSLAGTSHHPK